MELWIHQGDGNIMYLTCAGMHIVSAAGRSYILININDHISPTTHPLLYILFYDQATQSMDYPADICDLHITIYGSIID